MAASEWLRAVFQASAALARKKGKGLHKDMVIFWHKKKISECSVTVCAVGWLCRPLAVHRVFFPKARGMANPPASHVSYLFLGAFINLVLTLVSSGPSKKPFSLKEKKLGDGEASQGIEEPPFQHSPLGKPIVRPATGSLMNKRWDLPF